MKTVEIGHNNTYTTDWTEHYNTSDGPAKVEARRRLYIDCLEKGETPIWFDQLLFDTVEYAGLADDATIVDIGCAYPYDLQRWKQRSESNGKTGRTFIGVEPNAVQFGGMPYWTPSSSQEHFHHNDNPRQHVSWGHSGQKLLGIDLIKAGAEGLPLDDDSTAMASAMFSFYHVPKPLQPVALQEIRRVLTKDPRTHDVTGIFGLATSGNDNKLHMRHNETRLATALTVLTGQTYMPPEPLNSGFTTEDAEDILPQAFRHVYEYVKNSQIVIDSMDDVDILLEAYKTLRDKYTTDDGSVPSPELFDVALKLVLAPQISHAFEQQQPVTDLLRQSLFIASDRPLDLPETFREITVKPVT